MALPGGTIDERLNRTSAHLSQVQNKIEQDKTKMQSIDRIAQGSVLMVSDIAKCQLEIVRELLSQPPASRNYSFARILLSASLRMVKDHNLAEYRSLLSKRTTYSKEGTVVPLTAEMKEQLETLFAETLTQTVQAAEKEVQLDEKTDLEALKTKLQETMSAKEDTYIEMRQQKNELDNKVKSALDWCRQVSNYREYLLSPPPENIFNASQIGAMEYLRKQFASLWPWQKEAFSNQKDSEGFSALHHAAFHRQAAVVELFLQNKANPLQRDAQNYIPLHWAAKSGDVDCAIHLTKDKKHVHEKGGAGLNNESYGRTPLHMAAFNGRKAMVEYLIASEADVNAQTTKSDHSKTPLHEAVIQKCTSVALVLLKNDKLNVNLVDTLGWSPLRHAVEDGLLEITTLIVGHKSWKAPIDKSDPNHPEELIKAADKHIQVKDFFIRFFSKK